MAPHLMEHGMTATIAVEWLTALAIAATAFAAGWFSRARRGRG